MSRINQVWQDENWLELLEEVKLVETEVIWGINFTENLAQLAVLASAEHFHLSYIIEQLQAAIKERNNRSGSRSESTLIASDITYVILFIKQQLEDWTHERQTLIAENESASDSTPQQEGSTQLVETLPKKASKPSHSTKSIGISYY